jgi:hypothetical protein
VTSSPGELIRLEGGGRTVVQFAICDTAWEADDAAITPATTSHPVALWAMAWRARSAAWMIRNRRALEAAVVSAAA